MIERSNGHIAFVPRASGGTWEYWTRDGEIWRQDTTAPVMPDGYRSGRWYGADRASTRENLLSASRTVEATVQATVTGARTADEVAAYLPSNYTVVGEERDQYLRLIVRIAGTDTGGWTFDSYVKPRLASGLMSAELTS